MSFIVICLVLIGHNYNPTLVHLLIQHNLSSVTAADLDIQVAVHYGIPSTASIISFDPIQRLLAIGTL